MPTCFAFFDIVQQIPSYVILTLEMLVTISTQLVFNLGDLHMIIPFKMRDEFDPYEIILSMYFFAVSNTNVFNLSQEM